MFKNSTNKTPQTKVTAIIKGGENLLLVFPPLRYKGNDTKCQLQYEYGDEKRTTVVLLLDARHLDKKVATLRVVGFGLRS